MVGIFGGGRPPPNTRTVTFNADDPTLKRPVRIFISHRWEDDPAFRGIIVSSLNHLDRPIEDLSLTIDQRISGKRGGRVDDLAIQSEISNRIQLCHLFFAPGDTAAADDDWIQFETERAVEHKRPVVFVSKEWRRARWNRYVQRLKDLGHPSATVTSDPASILQTAKLMLSAQLH